MNLSLYGILLFFAAFLLHLIIWKIHIPRKNPSLVLLIIFFAVFVLSVIVSQRAPVIPFMPKDIFNQTLIFVFFISMTLAYIVSYSAIEINSPSLEIVLTITKAGPGGLDRERIERMFTEDKLIKRRINELVKIGLVYKNKDIYRLSAKGMLTADIFVWYRRILNTSKGG